MKFEEVKDTLSKAKALGRGMTQFGIVGYSEKRAVLDALEKLGVTYQVSQVAGDYDAPMFDIYADVATYEQ